MQQQVGADGFSPACHLECCRFGAYRVDARHFTPMLVETFGVGAIRQVPLHGGPDRARPRAAVRFDDARVCHRQDTGARPQVGGHGLQVAPSEFCGHRLTPPGGPFTGGLPAEAVH